MPCKRFVRALAAALWVAGLVLAGPTHAQNAFKRGLDAYLEGNYAVARNLWRATAEAGDEVAAFNLGVLYARGLGVKQDQAEAVRWYRQSAIAGYADAQFNLGAAYYRGQGVAKNLSQAVSWWTRAARQGHPQALYNLGVLYRRGKGVAQNIERALSLFRQAAALGDARAQTAVTELSAGQERPPDQLAKTEIEHRVRQDSRSSGAAAGVARHTAGVLSSENPAHWTVQVFAANSEEAARQFARDHNLGRGLRIYRAATDGKIWFKGIYGSFADKAAAQAAQADLRRRLPGSQPWIRSFQAIQAEARPLPDRRAPATPSHGLAPGVVAPQDRQAGDENDAGSAPVEGGSESVARPVSAASDALLDQDQVALLRTAQQAFDARDYEQALKIWQPLAEQGAPAAQYGLGRLYEQGLGVDRDFTAAFRWYERAAQQGYMKAQYSLGMLYHTGQGVARDDALALYWIQSAEDRGDPRAAAYLDKLHQ